MTNTTVADGPCDVDTDGDGTVDCNDGCPNDPLKIAPGICGCGTPDTDSDGDGTPNCNDGCPSDPLKVAPGVCGCGTADTDTDGDGTPNCNDGCPNDPLKIAAGLCGCGTADTDTDGDGTPNCNDGCPNDPLKIAAGVCGCGVADTDTDGDGTPNCNDLCPNDPLKIAPGVCGCGTADTDTDGDGTPNCNDGCPNDPLKIAAGVCGCGVADTDTDGDGTPNCNDGCPNDPLKIAPGVCGCGTADTDTDGDGTPNCNDGCPNDPLKIAAGVCGCGVADTDTDGDGTPNCNDGCPNDPLKIAPGVCGCGTADTDTDGDGTPNCNDGCPNDPLKIAAGVCGCGVADTDTDGDGTPNCNDLCPSDPLKIAPGVCGCGTADTDTDGDGTPNCNDGCPNDPLKIAAGVCGCGVADTDTDGDGTPNCNDGCPNDPLKIAAGVCGCGVADTDSDGDGTPNCNDLCPSDPAKTAPGLCGCGHVDELHTYFRDADNDGFGDAAQSVSSCSAPLGFVAPFGDCDDLNSARYPGATEICGNALDDDCDGLIDEPPISGNRIAAENQLTGNPPSEWDVVDDGDPSIQGFATDISLRTGETIDFKIKTDSTNYLIDVYRLGWYQGNGARKVATFSPSAPLPQMQPAPLVDASVGLVDCGNWSVSASWFVPCDAVTGVYFARLTRQDAPHQGKAAHVYFVVRDDQGHSDLLFQTSDSTWQAYNSYGGASLYRDFAFNLPEQRAFKVSYNRPINTRAEIAGLGKPQFFFNAEYPMLRWLERNGYHVSYSTTVDTERRAAELLEHRVFLSVGHDEYWSAGQRQAVENARDQGVHLAFFSGNSVFWKTRWEPSMGASSAPYRTLVCYKETAVNARIDPMPGVWTGTWRDKRFSSTTDGGFPENGLKGTLFCVNGIRADTILVPAADGRMRFWRETPIASLLPGQTATLTRGTLGHEWEEDPDNGWRPQGVVRLSSTTVDVSPNYIGDMGGSFGNGAATHAMTFFKRANGALVFSSGTIQWSWGLDGTHDRGPTNTDARMQQATVNLLADMGAQSTTLQSGLVQTEASNDTQAPTAVITAPASNSIVPNCDVVLIQGTAQDFGGGRVGAVEVTFDGGQRWRVAEGRETWSIKWMPSVVGFYEIRCRAIDDSGNIGDASIPTRYERRVLPNCPEMIFGPKARPRHPAELDNYPVELGVRFRASVAGKIHGIRFYKGAANPGPYQVHLWSNEGGLIANAIHASCGTTGWQQVMFPTPVPITANTTYVASYHSPGGTAAVDVSWFYSSVVSGHLTALQHGLDGFNSVYKYGPPQFPTDTYQAANYWCDVVFVQDP